MTEKPRDIEAQSVTWLTDAERQDMDSRREWIYKYPQFFGNAATVEGKLALVETVLKDEKALAGGRYALQCLGIVLGDAIAQAKDMTWYMLQSDMGKGPCLGIPETTVKIVPVTVFADLVARGDKIDVPDIFNYFTTSVDRLKAEYATMVAGSSR